MQPRRWRLRNNRQGTTCARAADRRRRGIRPSPRGGVAARRHRLGTCWSTSARRPRNIRKVRPQPLPGTLAARVLALLSGRSHLKVQVPSTAEYCGHPAIPQGRCATPRQGRQSGPQAPGRSRCLRRLDRGFTASAPKGGLDRAVYPVGALGSRPVVFRCPLSHRRGQFPSYSNDNGRATGFEPASTWPPDRSALVRPLPPRTVFGVRPRISPPAAPLRCRRVSPDAAACRPMSPRVARCRPNCRNRLPTRPASGPTIGPAIDPTAPRRPPSAAHPVGRRLLHLPHAWER
jgi:hypothetical protein